MFTVGSFEFDPDKFMKKLNVPEEDEEDAFPIKRSPGIRKKRITKKEKQRQSLEQQGFDFRKDVPEEVLDCLLNCLCSSCKKKIKSQPSEKVKKEDLIEEKIQNLFPDSFDDDEELDFEESDDTDEEEDDFLDEEEIVPKKGSAVFESPIDKLFVRKDVEEEEDSFNISKLFSRKGIQKFQKEEEVPEEGMHFLKRNAHIQKDPEPEIKPIQPSEPAEKGFGNLFPKFRN